MSQFQVVEFKNKNVKTITERKLIAHEKTGKLEKQKMKNEKKELYDLVFEHLIKPLVEDYFRKNRGKIMGLVQI